jgi:putative transposase
MVDYRRNRLAGGTFFFTVTLLDRRSRLLVDHIDLLRKAYREVRQERPFETDAIVVLPDHIHSVWTLPAGDDDYSGRWRGIKSRFTHLLKGRGIALASDARGEHRLWQRRFWEHTVRDADDLRRHVDYIHYNPVKHGLATTPLEWRWSSFHRYVKAGVLPADWAGVPGSGDESRFGE